jgi:hypothetical protein
VLKQATSVSAKPTSARSRISPRSRYGKPMKRPPNREAVYLEEFKRALAWGVLPTTDLGVLAVTAKKQFRKSRENRLNLAL